MKDELPTWSELAAPLYIKTDVTAVLLLVVIAAILISVALFCD